MNAKDFDERLAELEQILIGAEAQPNLHGKRYYANRHIGEYCRKNPDLILELIARVPRWIPVDAYRAMHNVVYLCKGIANGNYGYTPDEPRMYLCRYSTKHGYSVIQATPRYFNGFRVEYVMPLPLEDAEGGSDG